MTHDFSNRGAERAWVPNLSIPGGFEEDLPAIAKWSRENRPEHARRAVQPADAPGRRTETIRGSRPRLPGRLEQKLFQDR